MNFAFFNICYINNVAFDVVNVKTISSTFSLTIMAEDFSNYGHEILIPAFVTPEILRHWIILFETIKI